MPAEYGQQYFRIPSEAKRYGIPMDTISTVLHAGIQGSAFFHNNNGEITTYLLLGKPLGPRRFNGSFNAYKINPDGIISLPTSDNNTHRILHPRDSQVSNILTNLNVIYRALIANRKFTEAKGVEQQITNIIKKQQPVTI